MCIRDSSERACLLRLVLIRATLLVKVASELVLLCPHLTRVTLIEGCRSVKSSKHRVKPHLASAARPRPGSYQRRRRASCLFRLLEAGPGLVLKRPPRGACTVVEHIRLLFLGSYVKQTKVHASPSGSPPRHLESGDPATETSQEHPPNSPTATTRGTSPCPY